MLDGGTGCPRTGPTRMKKRADASSPPPLSATRQLVGAMSKAGRAVCYVAFSVAGKGLNVRNAPFGSVLASSNSAAAAAGLTSGRKRAMAMCTHWHENGIGRRMSKSGFQTVSVFTIYR